MRRWWIGAAIAIAIAACSSKSGSGSASGSSSGSASASGAPTMPPPPKVALVRCTPAPTVPYAHEAGILGSAALTQGGAFADLTGTGDIGTLDDTDIQGGLLGSDAGGDNGGFGFGKSNAGGGGTGLGTIGTGRRAHAKHPSAPSVSVGQPNAVGDLDKAIIRRYIKRSLNKIEYCYEKQLLVKPKLAGTVAAQFFIDPNGNVASSEASGVDADVATCVAAVIHDIEFPKPKGGGGVQVSYPFAFRPTGDATASAAPTLAPAAPPPPAPAPAPAPPPAPEPLDPWTPFATLSPSDNHLAGAVTVAVQGAVQARLAAIDTCFGASARGSLRAMLLVAPGGAVEVRAGGLGIAPVERCVAQELAKMHVAINTEEAVEVACDLARGPELAWRVSPDDFEVIEVVHDQKSRAPSGDRDVLVVVAPAADGVDLHAAAAHAPASHSTLYALRDGAGAPLYLGIDARGGSPARGPAGARLQLTFGEGSLVACVPGLLPHVESPPTRDSLDKAFAAIAAACNGGHCSDAVAVADDVRVDTGTVAAVLARARTVGFTRVVFDGPMDECTP